MGIPNIRHFGPEHVTAKKESDFTNRHEYVKSLMSAFMQQIASHASFILIYNYTGVFAETHHKCILHTSLEAFISRLSKYLTEVQNPGRFNGRAEEEGIRGLEEAKTGRQRLLTEQKL